MTFILIDALPRAFLIQQFIPQKATPPQKIIDYNYAVKVLGLNYPTPVQFLFYVNNLIHGNWGYMYSNAANPNQFYSGPVLTGIEKYFPLTLELSIFAIIFSIILAIPVGTYIGARPNSISDQIGRVFSLSGYAMPTFFLALLLQIAIEPFYPALIKGQGFPTFYALPWIKNGVSYPTHMLFFDSLIHGDFSLALISFSHLLLPVLTLTYGLMAGLLRFIRAGMVDASNQEYVKTARAKGVPEKQVLRKHIRKNALLPSITVFGLVFSGLLGGVVVIEDIFNLKGLGMFGLSTIEGGYIQIFGLVGTTLFFGILLVVANLVVDVVYALMDPRIRY
ncbi:binding-protein-dependent transport system inner membrane component [mine drainage metagenome]|uniref:Binding-protein-dependent transport system inner membrane component n=1 Tax=mine drainage metagenome TaxID=410659 RepID=T1C739_9ZZZZ